MAMEIQHTILVFNHFKDQAIDFRQLQAILAQGI